jgi:hypothetical protein
MLRSLVFGVLLTLLPSSAAGANRIFRDAFDPPETSDIRGLSDEFSFADSLDDWQRLWQVEHWQADQLQGFDIGATRSGWLTMLPYTSVWYEDYRGELSFQDIAGDFAVTTHVQSRNRGATGAPGSTHGGAMGSEFSLAGLMLRVPRSEWLVDRNASPAAWWVQGNERYVFLSFGSATLPGTYQFEVKTTTAAAPHSQSILEITDAPLGVTEADLRSVRIGPHVIVLRRLPAQAWEVHRRYRRDDMTGPLQVGMTCYTDWSVVNTWPYFDQNDTAITHVYNNPGALSDPDLLAQFDYVHFARPQVPAGLVGADLSNPAAVSDAQLLGFLGDML